MILSSSSSIPKFEIKVSLDKKFYVRKGEVGERKEKKDSEESQKSNSLKIMIKNTYSKPVLESENDEIFFKW